MPGKRYEAQDKRVQKMSREGLTEENLHSGERKRISSRTQDTPLVQEAANAPVRPAPDSGQPHAQQGKRQPFHLHTQDEANRPQSDGTTYQIRQDTGQPVVNTVQNEARLSPVPPGDDFGRTTHETFRRDAHPTSVNHAQAQLYREDTENAAVETAGRKQNATGFTKRAFVPSNVDADQSHPAIDGGITVGTEDAEQTAPPSPQMQKKPEPDGFTQIEAETVQNQAVTLVAIPAVQGVDTEQPRAVYSQDLQEPDSNEPIDQSDLAQGNHAGRLTEHSARMAEVRGSSTGRAALQTAAEMRHNRKKKQVQDGYRKYHDAGAKRNDVGDDVEHPSKAGEETSPKAQDAENSANQATHEPETKAAESDGAAQESEVKRPESKTADIPPPDSVMPDDASKPKHRVDENPYKTAFHQDTHHLTDEPGADVGGDFRPKARGQRVTREFQQKHGAPNRDASDSSPNEDTSQQKVKRDGGNREHPNSQRGKRTNQSESQEAPGTGKKKSSRLFFDDEENGMVRGAGMGIGRKAASAAAGAAVGYVHTKVHSVERENSAVEGAHKAEILGESGIHKVVNRVSQRRKDRKSNRRKESAAAKKESRLNFTPTESAGAAAATGEKAAQAAAAKTAAKEAQGKKSILNRFWQKKRYKEAYAAARNGKTAASAAAKATQTAGSKAKATIQSFFRKNKGIFIGAGVIALFVLIFGAILSSCTAMMQGTQNTFISSTYPSQDADIYAAENAYLALEEELNDQINNMESTHPGYDEYNYQIDEISHNPYQLISYLTAKYEEFTYAQVAGEVQSLFTQQYELIVDEVIETRTRTETRTGTRTVTDPETGEESEEEYEYEVEVEYEYRILNITLINHGFDSVARSNMDSDQSGRYTLYNATYGNRNYLFDTATLPTYTGDEGGFGYEIPAEALTDESFARMIAEAEKYLGYPYVWGGSSPSTSFDCSGFVCWVINNCGNGWNVGRTTANGLRSHCAFVSPEEAKPGDLIFFQGTYNTTGASHVGIYVGNGMMIHCGDPVQYTSVQTSYWQSHFLAYGRIQ